MSQQNRSDRQSYQVDQRTSRGLEEVVRTEVPLKNTLIHREKPFEDRAKHPVVHHTSF